MAEGRQSWSRKGYPWWRCKYWRTAPLSGAVARQVQHRPWMGAALTRSASRGGWDHQDLPWLTRVTVLPPGATLELWLRRLGLVSHRHDGVFAAATCWFGCEKQLGRACRGTHLEYRVLGCVESCQWPSRSDYPWSVPGGQMFAGRAGATTHGRSLAVNCSQAGALQFGRGRRDLGTAHYSTSSRGLEQPC